MELSTQRERAPALCDAADFKRSLPDHVQQLLDLATETSENLEGDVRMSSVLSVLAFKRAMESEGLDEEQVTARLALAMRAVKESSQMKRALIELHSKIDEDFGLKKTNIVFPTRRADEETVSRRKAILFEGRDDLED